MARFLTNLLATFDECDLSTSLVLDRPTERAHRVDVLDLATRSERRARLAHAHVGVAAHRTLFHLRVGSTDGHEDLAQFGDVLLGFVGRGDVGPTHDLDQRNTSAIEVDERIVGAMNTAAGSTDVRALARVFFEVCALDTDALAAGQFEPTVDVERNVVLRDLVRLGHVGVEVVLAVERAGLHRAVEGQADSHREFDGLTVEHGKGTGQSECHRVDVRVRIVTEPVGAGREQLGGRGEFDVNLEAHHQLVAVDHERLAHFAPPGATRSR